VSLSKVNSRSFGYALSVLLKDYESDTGFKVRLLVGDDDTRYKAYFSSFRERRGIKMLTSKNEYHNS